MLVPVVFILQRVWVIWPMGWVHSARWALLIAIPLLSGLSYRQAHRRASQETLSPCWRRWIFILMPLSLLPLGAVASLLADVLPPGLVSNVLFFLPVLIATVVINRAIAGIPSTAADEASTRRWAWRILGGTMLFFMGVGCYLSATTGEHAGDEGYYLIQARSLFQDGDLDLKNNLIQQGVDFLPDIDHNAFKREMAPAKADMESAHIAPNCLGGHWYSWHSFGLPLLLAPFWPGGMPLRQLLLGLISGAGCAGMLLLGRRLGASLRSSLVAVLLFAGSVYWTIYSVRSIPEVLGASLLIWVFWGIAAQQDKPWVSLWVTAACLIYLPFAHLRFLPPGLMGFGLYGLAGLCAGGSWGRKVFRLAVFFIVCLAGAAVFFSVQQQMFASGSSYPIQGVLFSYPLGAWAILVDAYSVTAVLPLFMWMAGAGMVLVATDRETRWFVLGIGATFVACLLAASTNTSYMGGSTVPGRYALAVVPLLIPVTARMLDRASHAARGWFVFLGMVSIALLVVTLVRLPSFGRDFVMPVAAVSGHPLLQGLFNPHSSFLFDPPWTGWVTSVYVAAGVGVTLVMLLTPRRKARLLAVLAVMVAAGIVGHRARANREARSDYDPGRMAGALSKLNLDRALVFRKEASGAMPLFQASCFVFPDVRNPQRRPSVTTQDLGERSVGETLSQPRIEANDWAGRGFRWTTLTAPISPARGKKLVHVGGRMEGTAGLVLAIREGSHTLFEGPLPSENGRIGSEVEISCRGKSGHLYVLVRLEQGEGVFRLDELYWSPYSARLLQSASLQLPDRRIRSQESEAGIREKDK
jgi:hypothetical protein